MTEPAPRPGGRPWLIAAAHLAAVALLLGSGLVHGRLTDRWGTSDALVGAVARLDRMPAVIGDWQGHDGTIDPKQIERAGIAGYKVRTYHNNRDGRDWTALLVCGRPGPIAVHTPDICYAGAGFRADAPPAARTIAGAGPTAAQVLGACFRKDAGAVPEALEILWSWDGRGSWEAPANPRLAFAHLPSLYKIYLVARRDAASAPMPSATVRPHDWRDAGPILEAIGHALADPGQRDPS